MAAHEQQNQRVVWIHVRLDLEGGWQTFRFDGHYRFSLPAGNFAAHLVRHAAACNLNQPAARVIGNALLRPLREGRDHGLLHGVFGRGEVAEAASDRAEHLRRKFTQQMLERSVVWMVCHLSFLSAARFRGPNPHGHSERAALRWACLQAFRQAPALVRLARQPYKPDPGSPHR